MIYRITRMSGLVLAFGIFFSISCSTLQKTESTPSQPNEQSLQQEIEKVNEELSENPDSRELRIEKADLLYRYSQTQPIPSNRKPVYQNIRDIANGFSSEQNPLNDIMVKAWRTEQRSGINLLQEDKADRSEQELLTIISHFENAVTILPDSLKSYNLLATTHYQHGNMEKAIETLEIAEAQMDGAKPEIDEKLAYLYLESGNLTEAEKRYRQLVENHPEKLLYKHGLVNILILSGQHEETVNYLEELSEEYPTRYNYQESLATEFYYLFKKRTDKYLLGEETVELTGDDVNEITDLLNNIHTIFESLQETLPTTEDNLFRMAAFYKNTSLRLKELSTVNEEVSFADLQNEYMDYALPLWERLAELKPENLGYISNLHDVYLELEMNEEAEALERSYNF